VDKFCQPGYGSGFSIRIRWPNCIRIRNTTFYCSPVFFWASRIRIQFLLSSSKNSKETHDTYCFMTSLWLFIFEKWWKNVPSKPNAKQSKKNVEKNYLLASWMSLTKMAGSGCVNPRIRTRSATLLLFTFLGMSRLLSARFQTFTGTPWRAVFDWGRTLDCRRRKSRTSTGTMMTTFSPTFSRSQVSEQAPTYNQGCGSAFISSGSSILGRISIPIQSIKNVQVT
jgi:hypothetical protein